MQVCSLSANAIIDFLFRVGLGVISKTNLCYVTVTYSTPSLDCRHAFYLEQPLHVAKVVVELVTSTELWWHVTDSGKWKYWNKNLSQWHFVHHKSHMDWLEICDGQHGVGQVFSPTRPTLVSPCQCHSTNGQHSFNHLPQTLSSLSSETELVVRGKLTVLYHNTLFAARPRCFHFK